MTTKPHVRGGLLRYKADRLPVAYVLAVLGIHFTVFLWASPVTAAACMLPLFLLSTCVAPINHHHQHLNAFRSPLLNRFYDVALALQTGIGPYGWVLHHNLGHHVNYLHQYPHDRPDESHWTRRDGATMGRFEYSLHLFLHHQFDIYSVGKRYPRQWRSYLLMKIPMAVVLATLAIYNPLNWLFVFVIPGLLTLFHTCWATYEHHAGLHADHHHQASVNRESRIFNAITFNLGLHTAHHQQPGLHWSLLPDLHKRIRDKIPEEMLLKGFW